MAHPLVRSTLRRARNVSRRTFLRVRDRWQPTYGPGYLGSLELARLIPGGVAPRRSEPDLQAARYFLQHRFDLLGSGWVAVRYGMRCGGFEGTRFEPAVFPSGGPAVLINPANRPFSMQVRARLSAGYEPIDWQVDFRSGFRWSEQTWYRDVTYGAVAGADVKVPWELSRMQHLPELALTYGAAPDPVLPREFADQVLDWIAQNPPRFGVNWACTMDVGIRVANLLVGFDLFRAAGARFDARFQALLAGSIADHARHILANLEWTETRRANHYLANISGLLIAAAYLPAAAQSDAWLLFAIQELVCETQRQFLADGGHFEASTSYHRLCAEMVATAAAFVRAVPKARMGASLRSPAGLVRQGPGLRQEVVRRLQASFEDTGEVLPPEFFARLAAAAAFSRAVMRADGSAPVIGDDDSGRFLRLGGWTDERTVA
jgi:hypothetical protein